MENQAGWHGKAPNEEQYATGQRQELVAALQRTGGQVTWQKKIATTSGLRQGAGRAG